jgi:hypothetical protein
MKVLLEKIMKKLFKVKDKYFENKMEAKKYRDELGGVDKGIYVQLGPDHKGPHGNKTKFQAYKTR